MLNDPNVSYADRVAAGGTVIPLGRPTAFNIFTAGLAPNPRWALVGDGLNTMMNTLITSHLDEGSTTIIAGMIGHRYADEVRRVGGTVIEVTADWNPDTSTISGDAPLVCFDLSAVLWDDTVDEETDASRRRDVLDKIDALLPDAPDYGDLGTVSDAAVFLDDSLATVVDDSGRFGGHRQLDHLIRKRDSRICWYVSHEVEDTTPELDDYIDRAGVVAVGGGASSAASTVAWLRDVWQLSDDEISDVTAAAPAEQTGTMLVKSRKGFPLPFVAHRGQSDRPELMPWTAAGSGDHEHE